MKGIRKEVRVSQIESQMKLVDEDSTKEVNDSLFEYESNEEDDDESNSDDAFDSDSDDFLPRKL